ncbi:hypothetical protein Gohar_021889 [Gossypium harknessii]|uniref:Uncharacterized protein n=1 Tax=Gossypium harknessii TaxID=34285 RepID=A0A7J9IES2_9ROSI|nr:hypothetical protein [Gossypium harknessii]
MNGYSTLPVIYKIISFLFYPSYFFFQLPTPI